jgi:hypothetical protein
MPNSRMDNHQGKSVTELSAIVGAYKTIAK